MNFAEMTIEQLETRKKDIAVEVEKEDADLDALEAEVKGINEELEKRANAIKTAQEKRTAIANGAGTVIKSMKEEPKMTINETRGIALKNKEKVAYGVQEVRSVLVSSGKIATPTGVDGINDIVGNNGSILDYVTVVDCEGMGSNKVAYVASEAGAAADQTEGSPATTKEGTFDYVTITPESVACIAQISKQTKKQSPLNYEAKVTAQAYQSLRKAATSKVVAKLKASTLTQELVAEVSGSNGVITDKTLRNIAFAYGGDNGIEGNAMLFLNKKDLIAFGDVRGTNEKKAVYEITPDGSNPNVGTIKDGGLTVRYCICGDLTALAGTAKGSKKTPTMFYGNPRCFELDLFSAYEIAVSEDFAFTSLMDTIRGDVELGGDVVVKNGFVAVTIPTT